jgi:hypothetical protein
VPPTADDQVADDEGEPTDQPLITVGCDFATIARCTDLVARTVQHATRIPAQVGSMHSRGKPALQAMSIDTEGRLVIPTGMVERVKAALDMVGVRYQIKDDRPEGIRRGEFPGENRLDVANRSVAPLAQVVLPDELHRAAAVAEIAEVDPNKRVVVVVRDQAKVHVVERRLSMEQRFRHPKKPKAGTMHRWEGVRVVTVHELPEHTREADVLVIFDAEHAAEDIADGKYNDAFRRIPIRLALRVAGRKLTPREALILEAFIGPVSRAGLTDVPRQVHVVKTPAPPPAMGVPPGKRLVRGKELAQHPERDVRIADLVYALDIWDASALQDMGLSVSALTLHALEESAIIVLVRDTDHLAALRSLLPEAGVVSGLSVRPASAPRPGVVTLMTLASAADRTDESDGIVVIASGPRYLEAVHEVGLVRQAALVFEVQDTWGPDPPEADDEMLNAMSEPRPEDWEYPAREEVSMSHGDPANPRVSEPGEPGEAGAHVSSGGTPHEARGPRDPGHPRTPEIRRDPGVPGSQIPGDTVAHAPSGGTSQGAGAHGLPFARKEVMPH